MKEAYYQHAFKRGMDFLLSKPISNILVILVVALSLMPSLFFWSVTHSFDTSAALSRNQIVLYLKRSVSNQEQKKLQEDILKYPQVEQVVVKSPDDGLKELGKQENLQDFSQYFQNNPLPFVMEILLKDDSNITPDAIEKLYQKLSSDPQIDESYLDLNSIKRSITALHALDSMIKLFLVVLISGVIFIIYNTLRLMILNQLEEIRIFKLLGASSFFIAHPFLYAGFFYGFFGGALSLCLVIWMMHIISPLLQSLAAFLEFRYVSTYFSVIEVLIFLCFSSIIGLLGAGCSIIKQLSAIEPS